MLAISIHAITCPENKVYIKLTKNSKLFASEEQVQIQGTGVYEESDTFENNSLFSWEWCLNATQNNQYEVWFYDSYGDSWSDGSWLQIEGPYGNIVFKNYMTEDQYEIFPLSLINMMILNGLHCPSMMQFRNPLPLNIIVIRLMELWEWLLMRSVSIIAMV